MAADRLFDPAGMVTSPDPRHVGLCVGTVPVPAPPAMTELPVSPPLLKPALTWDLLTHPWVSFDRIGLGGGRRG
jgi:hypothetical protein